VRTCGDGRCGLHGVFGGPRTSRNDLYLNDAAELLFATWDMPLHVILTQLAVRHQYLINRVVSKLWVDFVRPHWLHSETAPPEERIFLQVLRANCSEEFCGSIDICLQQQVERQRIMDCCKHTAGLHSKGVFTTALESIHWRQVAVARGLIPDNMTDYCKLTVEALNCYLRQLPNEFQGRCDWLRPSTEIVNGRVQVVGTNIPYLGSTADLPSCKYVALFDQRDCFDGLRMSLLSQICGPDWQNLSHLLSFDVDDDRFCGLLAFCTEYVSPLQEASHPVPEPVHFLEEAWKALRMAACHPQHQFYLSYDEVMLVCALRRENVLIFHRHGGENEATLLGELVVDTSQPVTMLSARVNILSGSTFTRPYILLISITYIAQGSFLLTGTAR